MFGKKPPDPFEQMVKDAIVSEMNKSSTPTQEFVKRMEMWSKLLEVAKSDKDRNQLSKDHMAGIAANLLGILTIVWHERVNFIGSKALSLLVKPKPM